MREEKIVMRKKVMNKVVVWGRMRVKEDGVVMKENQGS